MLDKVVLIICDGLGDRPIKELGYLTPLESANTPNLDFLAEKSECGMMYPLGRGLVPGSDISHLTIFGYADHYPGRGAMEVAGLGMQLQEGDIALRGNFATVDHTLGIIDRRAGRIRDVSAFARALDGIEIEGVRFLVNPGTAHRAGIIVRGSGLSNAISDADPHHPNVLVSPVVPTDGTEAARRTANLLNKFLALAHQVLTNHPENLAREERGEATVNYLLVRGAGCYQKVPSFKQRHGLSAYCVAGGGLYKGVGAYLGMAVANVPGATGLPDTDIKAKIRAALDALTWFDFVFLHIKATDSLGEDGNFMGKRDFIEKIDSALGLLKELPDNVVVVVTGDHSTPCQLRQHSADPVPIMFCGEGLRIDCVTTFGERACSHGGVGMIEGKDVMPHVLNLLGRSPLKGA